MKVLKILVRYENSTTCLCTFLNSILTITVTSLCEGQRDTGDRLPIYQTGTGRLVAVKHGSIKKSKAVLEDGDVKRSGKNTLTNLISFFTN